MMKYFQPYYLIALLVGIGIVWFDASNRNQASIFYGFAENKETEVNFNYPVIVKQLFVSEGQKLSEGDVMFHLQRVQPKEQLVDEDYKISELQAESRLQQSTLEGDLKSMEAKYRVDVQEINFKIDRLTKELEYKKNLYNKLNTLKEATLSFNSLEDQITALESEKHFLDSLYMTNRANLLSEIRMSADPLRAEINRLEAKKEFDAQQVVQDIEIKAPFDGLVGNINCKEAEHVPSFRTLLIYYEPNPTLVKGYIHEDLIMKINLGDSLTIRSTKDPEISSAGVVSGLGSRVVEIPTRLRRIPDMKTYGREVLISIPHDNSFIQKEKVLIEFL